MSADAHRASSGTNGGTPRRRAYVGLATHPIWFLSGLGAAALAINLALRWHVPLPFCLLREWTGIPCPACGSTRSLLAWSHLDPLGALRFNPLFFLACLGLILWTGAGLAERITRAPLRERLRTMTARRLSVSLALGLVALNWVYLYLTLPR